MRVPPARRPFKGCALDRAFHGEELVAQPQEGFPWQLGEQKRFRHNRRGRHACGPDWRWRYRFFFFLFRGPRVVLLRDVARQPFALELARERYRCSGAPLPRWGPAHGALP
eukprot:5538749-Pyramimonas_sp.AAC.1